MISVTCEYIISLLTCRAQAEADGILNQYMKEAESYKMLVSGSGLNLDTPAFLAYMGVRAIEDAPNSVYVGMKAPAKTNWLNQN